MDLQYLENNPLPDLEKMKGNSNPRMIVAHFSEHELKKLDQMQGGTFEDPKTGFREYKRLSGIIKIPAIRKLLDDIAAESMLSGHEDAGVHKLEKAVPHSLPDYVPSPSDFDPEVLETESHGQGGDNELALIPEDVADYFDSLRGGAEYNPSTGLRQYMFGDFKKIFSKPLKAVVNIGAPIVGAVLGGIPGSMIGGALGSGLTGGKLPQIATSAALSGLGAWGIPKLGSAIPGLGALFGSASNTSAPISTGNQFKDILLNSSVKESSPGLFEGIGNILKSPVLPLVAGAGMLYKGHKDYLKRQKQIDEEKRRELDELRKYYGIQSRGPRIKNKYLSHTNPELPSYWDRQAGREHMHYEREPIEYEYANGGHVGGYKEPKEEYVKTSKLIKDPMGPTKGQEDPIKITIPEGAYIIDASTTSMIGDGSSEAGAHELDKLSSILRKIGPRIVKKINKSKGPVKALLSNDEYHINQPEVSILGGGNNEIGARILKKMVKNIRKSKSKNKDGLPPKLEPLYKYLPKEDIPKPIYNQIKKVSSYA